ncbi:Tricarboxylate/iron carrier [Catenaria anguillulae PL171]|uniref:Tricarboxylate/iron carrier n=1 Tax=Catenaria anguillulae PL171 TaxID=765915 RepID=A0A1Y2HAR4_9FUNG|nr:Tricarboxylate/iron carrier [Catenaria anguillulae PL171]
MSCFVPTNMFFAGIVFWQWLNQSVNVAVNYANANKTTPMSMTETATAYAGAVTASCGVALGLNRLAEQGKLPRPLIRLFPNVFLMRQKELREGIAVTDEQGNEVGKSTAAGWQAVSQVRRRLTRCYGSAMPGRPPMVMSRLKPLALFRNNPRLLIPAELAVVAGSLMGALPCAIALFPQQAKVPVSSLEPKFHNFKDTEGNPITHVFYNKGL